jgi:hypothetical protein
MTAEGPAAKHQVAQFGIASPVGDHRPRRIELQRLLGQQSRVLAAHQCPHPELRAVAQQLDRLGADAARAAQNTHGPRTVLRHQRPVRLRHVG